MTITLQAVNELIASLESAGELSIREQKFLKLAKAYQQLAAENVAMRETIEAVRGVADNSRGIAGWHLNGEIAQWSEILPEIDDIETPVTDRIVAGIKADGVEEWVSSRGGRWNGTTEEALKFAKQLREGADK
ncbi:hypothetical protein LNO16_24040 [Klebsiella quasipneumoniae subsp. quasipneumoniae]|uniref:hypothetical protein n=1 Tax=Klebsiella quasipneumoniae TaxID=1463165 RepID=UPI00217D4794|nr:hypothetical protein [Klebsiella quasipneumoniae]MCS5751976.1 hypothetical protein [Klebsiella quasipneumoniae subsp. quasipneumoniae]